MKGNRRQEDNQTREETTKQNREIKGQQEVK